VRLASAVADNRSATALFNRDYCASDYRASDYRASDYRASDYRASC
jgi:hypothetical protein